MCAMRAAALAIACCGCAQLFGIEDTTSSPGNASTLELQRVSVGAAVAMSPLDLGSAAPAFLVDDAGAVTSVPATPGTAGTWSAPVTSSLGVLYTAPDLPTPYQHELAVGGAARRGAFVAFEHPSPMPPPASMVAVNVTLSGVYAAGQSLQIIAIGAWTGHVLSGAELPAVGTSAIAATIPYSEFLSLTASPAASITTDDVVVVASYTGSTLTGQLIVPPFAQSTGTDSLTGTMAAVTPTTPFDAHIDNTAAGARLTGLPLPAGGLASSWQLIAAPGHALGIPTGIELDAAPVALTDTTFSSSYANPFAGQGWQPLLVHSVAGSRTFTVGGAMVSFDAALATVAEPAANMMLDQPAGLAGAIFLGSTALTTDGMTVTEDPATALHVSFTPDRPSSSLFDVLVEEIVVVGGAATRTSVIELDSTSSMLTLPPGTLHSGHTYVLDVTCVAGGYPSAAAGDLQTFALPVSYGLVSSAVFTLAP